MIKLQVKQAQRRRIPIWKKVRENHFCISFRNLRLKQISFFDARITPRTLISGEENPQWQTKTSSFLIFHLPVRSIFITIIIKKKSLKTNQEKITIFKIWRYFFATRFFLLWLIFISEKVIFFYFCLNYNEWYSYSSLVRMSPFKFSDTHFDMSAHRIWTQS